MKEQFLNLTGLTELVGYLKTSIANHKEILPYASNKLFPSVGDINTIYIDTATNTIYRWDSSSKTYVTLAKAVKSVVISEATENGKITLTVDGNKTTVPIHGLGSAAYTNSSAYSPAGHTHTKAQVGLGNVDNTADANKSVKHATTANSATTAGTATNVSAGEGTADAARHVWFSDSTTETKRAYSDKFKYNPVTNNLTVNVTGNAATASSVAWGNVTGKPSTYAPSAHNHNDSTITSLNASKLFGTIDIARLPHGALERCVIVADDTARFALTTAKIQLGDTVKVNKTQKMYFVIDESKLSSEAGYTVYTAGSATSVPWSGITGKPTTFTPSSHTHPYLSALSVSGKTITYTKGDGTTGTITTQDTWRGIQNNLTSTSTTDSLSAAQGKILKGLVDGKLSLSGGTMTGNISYKGSKASTEIIKFIDNVVDANGNGIAIGGGGLTIVGGGESSDIVKTIASGGGDERLILSNDGPIDIYTNCQDGLSKATHVTIDNSGLYSGTAAKANSVPWTGVTGRPSSLPASDVYAWAKASTKPSYTKAEVGLGSVDNTADSAKSVKYATSAGSANAVAWANVSGKPSITGKQTRTLTASGPSGWKDAATDQGFVPDMAFMAYWNGAYSGSSSNLAYCNRGAFGTIVTKNAGDYATASHTHHYAGSSSAGGAATSANKLATARTVSGGTDVTLSFNYDGSGNSSANIGFYSSSASVGNTNNYPFHRFAKLDTITGSYVDKSTTFFISQDYSGGGFGIVRITLRTNDSKTVSSVEVKWLVRSGLNADSVQVGLYNVYGKTYADAFFKTGGSYAGTYFRAIASGARGGASRTWVMVSSSETNGTTTSDPKTSAECYASIASAGTKLHNQAYSATISGSDTGTASYANSAGSVAWANVSGRPSSMPASDVSAWAKASSKPSYSWGEITGKPSTFTPASHTHNYAGSSSAGGNANAAVKLATARKIGNASFDGTANITLSQMGLNIPVEITKADYLAKKKAGTLNANTYYNVIDEYDSANVINDSSVTANSAFSSTKSEKTYAKKSAIINTTLTASKWTGSSAPYTYVLPVSGATTSNIVEINYASNASSQAIEAYQNAMLADGGQTTNQITIKATEKPTVDIPITIVIRNDL